MDFGLDKNFDGKLHHLLHRIPSTLDDIAAASTTTTVTVPPDGR